MEKHASTPTAAAAPETPSPALFKLGLSLRLAFVGGALASTGVAALVSGSMGLSGPQALAWTAAGAVIAALGARWTVTLLARVRDDEPVRKASAVAWRLPRRAVGQPSA
jgi:hypothetical protein